MNKQDSSFPRFVWGRLQFPILLAGFLFCSEFPCLKGQSAVEVLREGDTLTALRLLDEEKQKDPERSVPYLYSVQAMILDGRESDAEAELASMPFPQDLSGTQLVELARMMTQLGRRAQAADLLQSVPDRALLPAEGLWILSDLQLDLKQYEEALGTLKAYALRSPNDPRILIREGKLQILAGQLEAALTTFENAVDARPDEPEAYYEMARTLRFGNNLSAAKRVMVLAVERKGADPDYLHLQGIIAAGLGEDEIAVGFLTEASQMEGAPSQVFFDLGNALRRLGSRDESRAALSVYQDLFRAEEAEKNRTQSLVQLVNQGVQQLQTGNAGAARASFLRALELDPDHYFARVQLIQIYLSSGTLAQAQEELSTLRQTGDETAETTFMAAYLRYQEKNLSSAASEAETSRKLRPGNPELRNLLGNIYFAQGKKQEALKEYLAATRLAPDQMAYQANYRSLARQLGVVP